MVLVWGASIWHRLCVIGCAAVERLCLSNRLTTVDADRRSAFLGVHVSGHGVLGVRGRLRVHVLRTASTAASVLTPVEAVRSTSS